ncbi:MAG: RimK family protein, partial [Rhodospirillaceae bacterium]|nr:RimK family protein [Rhodospirillaceae bacterium]
PQLFCSHRPTVINLSRNTAYQSTGYYASLLAGARGHRVMPTVQTMLELSRKDLYRAALPDLEDKLNRCLKGRDDLPGGTFKVFIAFGRTEFPGLDGFSLLLFDWFRCPLLEVSIESGAWYAIERIRVPSIHRLDSEQKAFAMESMERQTKRGWQVAKGKVPARYSLAVLHNPREALPPSKKSSLQRLAVVARRFGVEVDPIEKGDLARLAEYDALFIRETTSIDNHTYRFARRAEQEGMPVIDDTVSMIRCTNKVYLKELLESHNISIPRSLVLSGQSDLEQAERALGFPMVVKIPDGSFSRGVHKVENRQALHALATKMFVDTDLLLAQEFMPTKYDWRVGVLGGEPLFACQYLMARDHWQIIKHTDDGKAVEGSYLCVAVEDAPPEVIQTAVKAARLIGTGLYGVDLKQNENGVHVIEINDNPNLDSGIEGAIIKDALWSRLVQWFLARLEEK